MIDYSGFPFLTPHNHRITLYPIGKDDFFGMRVQETLASIAPDQPAGRAALCYLLRKGHSRTPILLQRLGGDQVAIFRAALREARGKEVDWVLTAVASEGAAANPLVPDIIRLLRSDAAGTRCAAVEALTRIGVRDNAVRAEYIRLLADPHVTDAAIKALAGMGTAGRDAIPSLMPLLLDMSPSIRGEAVKALAQIGPNDPKVLAAVLETLGERNSQVRQDAVEALSTIVPLSQAGRSALRKASQDPDEAVRLAAGRALLSDAGGKKDGGRVLRALLSTSRRHEVQIQAALALWKAEGSREAVTVLAGLLRVDDARPAVVETLRQMGLARKDLEAALRPLLGAPRYKVRQAAWELLQPADGKQ